MPRLVDGDEGGRMEIEIYLPMQSISPALLAGLIDFCTAFFHKPLCKFWVACKVEMDIAGKGVFV